MEYSLMVNIENLMIWQRGNWNRVESRQNGFTLRVIGDQLILTADTRILETLNMNTKIKGIYKEDVLILVISKRSPDTSNAVEIRKIKFQIKSNVSQCLESLGRHFPVVSHNGAIKNKSTLQYHNLENVLKHALEKKDLIQHLPPVYTDFVKLCLLDPNFPALVTEAETILKTL